MWAHPGKQLLFMGQELGNPWEWNQAHPAAVAAAGLPAARRGPPLVGDLNRVYRRARRCTTQDFTPDGFTWLDANDRDGNVLAYLRWGSDGSVLACVLNFSADAAHGYRVGLPFAGVWREAVNTDSELTADPAPATWVRCGPRTCLHGQPASATLTLPPLGALWLVPD